MNGYRVSVYASPSRGEEPYRKCYMVDSEDVTRGRRKPSPGEKPRIKISFGEAPSRKLSRRKEPCRKYYVDSEDVTPGRRKPYKNTVEILHHHMEWIPVRTHHDDGSIEEHDMDDEPKDFLDCQGNIHIKVIPE